MSEDAERRLGELERKVAKQANLIDKLQNELIRAGRYDNADSDNLVRGIQVFLTKAGEAKGRDKGRRR